MITMPKRFGMFVHWGPYAIEEWHEQIRMRRGISRADYARMAAGFDPKKYDPEAWVRVAKEAGLEYICFTTKHHDGFCMWNTAQTDFNIVKTSGRDVLAELAEACRRHGLALSLYYSIPDWNHLHLIRESVAGDCQNPVFHNIAYQSASHNNSRISVGVILLSLQ